MTYILKSENVASPGEMNWINVKSAKYVQQPASWPVSRLLMKSAIYKMPESC